MRIDLHILFAMKTETKHTAKALALVAVPNWPGLMTYFRCLRWVFKQQRCHLRWWIWAKEDGWPNELMPATEVNSIFQYQAQRCKEPSHTAIPRILQLYLSINTRCRQWEIVRSYHFFCYALEKWSQVSHIIKVFLKPFQLRE